MGVTAASPRNQHLPRSSISFQTGELTLGPVLFNWAADRDFYFRVADEAPLDIVYLG